MPYQRSITITKLFDYARDGLKNIRNSVSKNAFELFVKKNFDMHFDK